MKRVPLLVLLALSASIVVASCLGRSQMTAERLRDAVVGYNDELRFGRLDLAVQRVSPELRGQFIGSHYRWGREFTIADAEIVNVEAIGEDFDRAVSFVTFQWVPMHSSLMRETLIRQEWRKDRQEFILVAEAAIDGDLTMLAIPEGFRPEASGLALQSEDAGTHGDAAVDADAGVAPSP